MITFNIKILSLDFPGGTVVKNLPANAGDMGSSPGPGRSYMLWSNSARVPQVLSLHTTTTEAHVPRAHAPRQEATAMRSPRSPQLEKARAQQRRPNTAKNQ